MYISTCVLGQVGTILRRRITYNQGNIARYNHGGIYILKRISQLKLRSVCEINTLDLRKWTLGASISLPHTCEACALPIELNAHDAESSQPELVETRRNRVNSNVQLY